MSGPTPKQIAFANGIVSGLSPLEAYRAAGYSRRMGAAAQSVEANRLLHNPKIALIVEEGRAEAARAALWSREKAIERLQAVNDRAIGEIEENGLDGLRSGNASRAFFDSLDRLNDMTAAGGGGSAPTFVYSPDDRSDRPDARVQPRRPQR